ncbi:transporter associated domain-containing protein, partial [Streptomyces sparsogenes]|uniref:transporter associated domain-containing protein n=1 Tax=Streptomyces sparsogenes TaxID=67365 RepID=UPI00247FEF49
YDADGAARVDQLEAIGMRVPHGPYETLAGLVATELGRIPVRGDALEVAGWGIEVAEDSGHRAARVRLRAPSPETGEDCADGEHCGAGGPSEGRDDGAAERHDAAGRQGTAARDGAGGRHGGGGQHGGAAGDGAGGGPGGADGPRGAGSPDDAGRFGRRSGDGEGAAR